MTACSSPATRCRSPTASSASPTPPSAPTWTPTAPTSARYKSAAWRWCAPDTKGAPATASKSSPSSPAVDFLDQPELVVAETRKAGDAAGGIGQHAVDQVEHRQRPGLVVGVLHAGEHEVAAVALGARLQQILPEVHVRVAAQKR